MRPNPLLMTVMGNPGRRYRSNPFILIDSATNKIIRTWRGSMMDRKPWLWAQDAARRLGRSVFVVAHPYVPPSFRAGIEVSPLFYFGGSYQAVHPDGTMSEGPAGGAKRMNPGFLPSIAGGVVGSLVANAMSNPPRTQKGAERALDAAIGRAWAQLMSGVQVPIMDIPRIFRDIKLEMAAGADLESAVRAVGGRYRVNMNPRGFPTGRMCQHGAANVSRCPHCRSLRRAGRPLRKPCRHGLYYECTKCPSDKMPKRMTRSNPGRSRKTTMPIEKFAKLVKEQRDPALWRDFVAKCKAYHKWSHGTWPKKVTVETVRKPGVKGMWITFDMGREPEKTYVMPKGTKRKGAWKHEWEGMPQLRGDAEAGFILTKLGKGNRLTDFLHG